MKSERIVSVKHNTIGQIRNPYTLPLYKLEGISLEVLSDNELDLIKKSNELISNYITESITKILNTGYMYFYVKKITNYDSGKDNYVYRQYGENIVILLNEKYDDFIYIEHTNSGAYELISILEGYKGFDYEKEVEKTRSYMKEECKKHFKNYKNEYLYKSDYSFKCIWDYVIEIGHIYDKENFINKIMDGIDKEINNRIDVINECKIKENSKTKSKESKYMNGENVGLSFVDIKDGWIVGEDVRVKTKDKLQNILNYSDMDWWDMDEIINILILKKVDFMSSSKNINKNIVWEDDIMYIQDENKNKFRVPKNKEVFFATKIDYTIDELELLKKTSERFVNFVRKKEYSVAFNYISGVRISINVNFIDKDNVEIEILNQKGIITYKEIMDLIGGISYIWENSYIYPQEVTKILKMINADRQQAYDTLKRMIVLAKMKSGGKNDK